METNWIIVGIAAFAAILLIIFLIKRNKKDEKELIEYLDKEELNKDKDDNEVY